MGVGLSVDADKLDSVAVLQFPNKDVSHLGGGRTRDLIHEIFSGLTDKSPSSGAVPPNLPLLRTLQLAADAQTASPGPHRLIEPTPTVS